MSKSKKPVATLRLRFEYRGMDVDAAQAHAKELTENLRASENLTVTTAEFAAKAPISTKL